MGDHKKRVAAKRSNAARLFGYDLFISFALGPPPRGTHSYASDLARRLRERDFTVFFSEDEAPPGEQLDSTLLGALRRSRTLVVIANRDTLEDPRWVRKEVEEFRRFHPSRPVIPISVGGAIQDLALSGQIQQWLLVQDKDRIWLDEAQDASEHGIVSDAVVERLAMAPARYRSNVRWRWIVRGVAVSLTILAIALGISAKVANDARKRAEDERKLADDARGRAEGLVQYLLFDLSSKLKTIGRLDLMDSVNGKVKDYYSKLAAEGGSKKAEIGTQQADSSSANVSRVTQQMVMDYDRAASLVSEGDALLAEGKRAAARTAYAQSFEIIDRLVQADPANAEWLTLLALTNDRLGDVEEMAGSLDKAQRAYEEGLTLRKRLIKEKPDRADWQRNLWVSYNKLSDVLVARGKLDLAREHIQQGLAIAKILADVDSKDKTRQLDLAASYEKLGELEVKAQKFDAANKAYAHGLGIRQAVASADPRDALLQRDLAMSNRELGDAAEGAGDAAQARQAYERSIAIMKQLTGTDRSNKGWQHDLGALYVRLGDLELDARHLEAAAEDFGKGVEIGQELTGADPDNEQWQADLAVNYERFGVLLELNGEIGKALMFYQAGRTISERLVERNPGNAVWQGDLEWVNRKIAKLKQ
jgi:tetratricopeptide (TPR) repeat protein